VSDTGSSLRATSDALIQDLERLTSLEREKRELKPDDPRLVILAGEVEEIAERVLGHSVQQRELTEEARAAVKAGDPDAPRQPIAATPREIHTILAEWRDAERRASEARPGSAAARAAELDIDRLRDEYRRAHDTARRPR
jgi:hypothetical protein